MTAQSLKALCAKLQRILKTQNKTTMIGFATKIGRKKYANKRKFKGAG